MENNNCICRRQPVFTEIQGKQYYSVSQSTEAIVEGEWSQLCVGADANGSFVMIAVGDDESDFYYPKFCPECGRELN